MYGNAGKETDHADGKKYYYGFLLDVNQKEGNRH